jgi:hypothetical protein
MSSYKNSVLIFISSLRDRQIMKSFIIQIVLIRNSKMHHDNMYLNACLLRHTVQLMILFHILWAPYIQKLIAVSTCASNLTKQNYCLVQADDNTDQPRCKALERYSRRIWFETGFGHPCSSLFFLCSPIILRELQHMNTS